MTELPDWYKRPSRGQVQIIGVDGAQAKIRVAVDPLPPSEDWISSFNHADWPEGMGRRPRIGEVSMGKCFVEGSCRDQRLEDYVAAVGRLIDQVSDRYEESDIPQIVRQEQAEAEAKTADEKRVAELKRRAEGL